MSVSVGAVVRWAFPVDAGEAAERYEVLEVRGSRVLVRLVCDLPVPPTYTYAACDFVRAELA